MEEKKTSKKRIAALYGRRFLCLCLCLMAAYGTAHFITDFLVQPVRVTGISMEDTLFQNDILLVDKVSYRLQKPARFDLVIFPYSMKETYIKRIIGLPGDTVQIKDGQIYINGEQLLEEYGSEKIEDAGIAADGIILGMDEYFVLGDNRNYSTDSRSPLVGPVKKEKLEGKVTLRIHPFSLL